MSYKKTASQKDSSVEEIIGKPEVKKIEPIPVAASSSPEPKINVPSSPSFNYDQPRYAPQVTPTQEVSGILDIQPEGHGFLRPKFIPSSRDVYISQSQIRRFLLRPGDLVKGLGRPPKDTERYFGLLKVEKVNDMPADDSLKRPYFDDLT